MERRKRRVKKVKGATSASMKLKMRRQATTKKKRKSAFFLVVELLMVNGEQNSRLKIQRAREEKKELKCIGIFMWEC